MKPSARNVALALTPNPQCTVTLARRMDYAAGASSIPKRITELRREGFTVFGGQADPGGFCDVHDHAGRTAQYWIEMCLFCRGAGGHWAIGGKVPCGVCYGTGIQRLKEGNK